MKKWFLTVVAPSWAALYIGIFKGFGAWMYVSLVLLYGVIMATFVMIFLYWLWGVIFYLILLESDTFEHFKTTLENFLLSKDNRLFTWLRSKFFHNGDQASISPILLMTMFIAESPLTGVPLVRFAYGKEKLWVGVFWITIGSVLEVITWFLPVYGLGISTVKFVLLDI